MTAPLTNQKDQMGGILNRRVLNPSAVALQRIHNGCSKANNFQARRV